MSSMINLNSLRYGSWDKIISKAHLESLSTTTRWDPYSLVTARHFAITSTLTKRTDKAHRLKIDNAWTNAPSESFKQLWMAKKTWVHVSVGCGKKNRGKRQVEGFQNLSDSDQGWGIRYPPRTCPRYHIYGCIDIIPYPFIDSKFKLCAQIHGPSLQIERKYMCVCMCVCI